MKEEPNKKESVKEEKPKDEKKLWLRIGSAVLIIILGIYMFHDIFSANRKVYETQITEMVTEQETVSAKAFVVRDEELIDHEKTGTVVPVFSDGNRVADGDVIARAFKSDKDAENYAALVAAKAEKERYIELSNSTQFGALNMEKLNSDIDKSYSELLKNIGVLDYTDIGDNIDSLKGKLACKQILIDGSADFSDKLAEIDDLIYDLENKGSSYDVINAPSSGYYISNLDGYEKTVDYNDVTELNVSQVENIINSNPSQVDDNMGKIVKSYKWYIITVLDGSNEAKFSEKEKKTMKVNIPYYGIKDVKTVVEHISEVQDGKFAVVLSCNLMNETYANLRTFDAELVINEYTGLKIPATAPQTLNEGGKTFTVAFCLRGTYMTARIIDIIYTPADKDYIIVSANSTSDYYEVTSEADEEKTYSIKINPIQLYDEIIVKGKGLKHGKSIA